MENQLNESVTNIQPDPVAKKGFLSNLNKRQKTSLLTLVALLIILPITTALALLATRLNSRAYLPSTPPTPPVTITPTITPTSTPSATPVVCKNPLVGFTTSKLCNITSTNQRVDTLPKTTQGYLEATITCQNGYKEKYTSPKCLDAASLKAYAAKVCEQKATCPTPTVKNNPPKIETSTLKPSIKNKDYQEVVIATDADKGDTVTMSAAGLPANLKLVCVGKALGRATCQITGVPEKTGQFTVLVTARDNKGGTTSKNFTLRVLPANTR